VLLLKKIKSVARKVKEMECIDCIVFGYFVVVVALLPILKI
jgi:hypothetical protein